jgi:DNA transformation protein
VTGFHDFVVEVFAELGPVRIKRLFDGAGIYAGDVMFALISEDTIYLKTDEALRAALAAEGAHSWIYTEKRGPKAGVPQETSYWSLPDAALNDPSEAAKWGRSALEVASAKKAAARKRKR